MLSYFRKLRFRFIPKKQIRNYFLYATGEILLVVIGILIALQINTWNNNRLLRQEEYQYMVRQVNDLKQDLVQLDFVISVNNFRLVKGVEILDQLDRSTDSIKAWLNYKNALKDSFAFELPNLSFGEKLTSLRYYTLFEETDITFQDFIANGKMEIIQSEEIKLAILHHYRHLKVKKELQRLVMKARDDYVEMMKDRGISMTNFQDLESIKQRLTDDDPLYTQIENFLFITTIAINNLLTDDDSIRIATEQLLSQIEYYLQEIQ